MKADECLRRQAHVNPASNSHPLHISEVHEGNDHYVPLSITVKQNLEHPLIDDERGNLYPSALVQHYKEYTKPLEKSAFHEPPLAAHVLLVSPIVHHQPTIVSAPARLSSSHSNTNHAKSKHETTRIKNVVPLRF